MAMVRTSVRGLKRYGLASKLDRREDAGMYWKWSAVARETILPPTRLLGVGGIDNKLRGRRSDGKAAGWW